jgi:hypothetical protein
MPAPQVGLDPTQQNAWSFEWIDASEAFLSGLITNLLRLQFDRGAGRPLCRHLSVDLTDTRKRARRIDGSWQ